MTDTPKPAEPDALAPVTVPLRKPVTKDGKAVAELTFRPATVGQVIATCDRGNAEDVDSALYALMCGMDPDEFQAEVWAGDMEAIREKAGPLTGRQPQLDSVALLAMLGGIADAPTSDDVKP